MPVIRNKLNQRIIINLNSGKNIDLLAKGTADVTDEELSSSHLQTLLSKGGIILGQKEEAAEKEEPKKTSYVRKGK